MNDNEINIAIAEAVKWKPSVDSGICWDDNGKPIVSPPSYSTELNAMHAAEKVLKPKEWGAYTRTLNELISQGDKGIMQAICHATARQRAEAFLRTLGKWKD